MASPIYFDPQISSYLNLTKATEPLSSAYAITSKFFQNEKINSAVNFLKEPAKKFVGIMLINEVFQICNRSSLAAFLLINKVIKEALDTASPLLLDQIVTKEKITSLRKVIETSDNPEFTRSSLAILVTTTFLYTKFLQCKIATSMAEFITENPLKIKEIVILFFLKEAVLMGATATAISTYKKL